LKNGTDYCLVPNKHGTTGGPFHPLCAVRCDVVPHLGHKKRARIELGGVNMNGCLNIN